MILRCELVELAPERVDGRLALLVILLHKILQNLIIVENALKGLDKSQGDLELEWPVLSWLHFTDLIRQVKSKTVVVTVAYLVAKVLIALFVILSVARYDYWHSRVAYQFGQLRIKLILLFVFEYRVHVFKENQLLGFLDPIRRLRLIAYFLKLNFTWFGHPLKLEHLLSQILYRVVTLLHRVVLRALRHRLH